MFNKATAFNSFQQDRAEVPASWTTGFQGVFTNLRILKQWISAAQLIVRELIIQFSSLLQAFDYDYVMKPLLLVTVLPSADLTCWRDLLLKQFSIGVSIWSYDESVWMPGESEKKPYQRSYQSELLTVCKVVRFSMWKWWNAQRQLLLSQSAANVCLVIHPLYVRA